MGLTPGGGILMGTRTGDLDPGLMLYLLREQGYTPESLEHLLERESGLLGVAGSADVRELSARLEHDAPARLALKMLGYAVRKTIGGYIAALGGLDVLVFTGGIGEHRHRGSTVRRIAVAIDAVSRSERCCAAATCARSQPVRVVERDADRMIAWHAFADASRRCSPIPPVNTKHVEAAQSCDVAADRFCARRNPASSTPSAPVRRARVARSVRARPRSRQHPTIRIRAPAGAPSFQACSLAHAIGRASGPGPDLPFACHQDATARCEAHRGVD